VAESRLAPLPFAPDQSGPRNPRSGAGDTISGTHRLGQWRHEWLALACPELPVVIGPDRTVLPRSGALGYLAAAADRGAPAAPRLPAASAGSRSRFRRDQ
jgi:hypothetical protein